MKKLLALVLALVMTLSLAVVGSNAAFKDAEKVNASYAEAVDVLAGMKVFQGYPDGSFQPEGSITRAEVAAIVYRLYTADVTDKQASLYATYNKFTDMDGAAWAKGYIGYCGNAGLIKGYDAKTFGPADKVTGYQALAMILRAVGYDKNDEFTGAQWQLRVASTAQQLGILKNVKGVDLNAAASRELVAELLFRTAAYVPMVTYTPALGYTNLTAILNGKANATLGEKNFGLTKSADQEDAWGRPYYTWYGEYNNITGYQKSTKDALYATVKATPVKTYYTAVKECEVATDLGLKAETKLPAYTNGKDNKGVFVIEPTDTINSLGAQGRLTEVYEDRIVMIDTFLAKVVKVSPATFDKAGHLAKYAEMQLAVYDKKNAATTIYEYSSTDFTYVKDEYILLNAYTNGWKASTFDNTIKTKNGTINARVQVAAYSELIGKAETITGAQTSILVNAKQHIVNGTTYNDANTYFLDDAAQTPLVNFTWFLDTYGNVIGSAKIAATYTYAVLKDLVWNLGTPGYATATLVNAATGEESKVTVKSIDGSADKAKFASWDVLDATPIWTGTNNSYNFVAKDTTTNTPALAYVAPETFMVNTLYKGYALYRVNTLSTGAVVLEGVDKNGTEITSDDKAVVSHATGVEYFNQATSLYANGTYNPVNDATVFTVRVKTVSGGYEYKQYVGKMNMPTIKSAEVFYVNANGDSYVDYVYVKDCVVDNSGKSFVMATSNTYYGNLYNDANVYVLKNALVNGEAKENAVMTTTATANGKTAFDTIVAGVNKPFYVTYDVNGYLNSATAFNSNWANGQLTPAAGATNLYYGIISVKDADVANGTLVSSTNDTFFVNNVAEKVIGDYAKIADVKDWSAVTVYLVYSVDAAHFNNRVVSQLYIMDNGLPGTPGTEPAPGVVSLSLNNVGKTVNAALTLTKVQSGARVELKYRAADRTDLPYSTLVYQMNYTGQPDGAAVPNYAYTEDLSSKLNGSYELVAEVYMGTKLLATSNAIYVY